MNADRCDEELGPGLRCDRDYGHSGPHHIEGDMPPSIGRLIEGVMTDFEEAAEKHRAAALRYMKARRGYLLATVGMVVAAIANLLALAVRSVS